MHHHIVRVKAIPAIFALLFFSSSTALGWHDRTHLAISEAAGFSLWFSSAAPDVAKSKKEFRAIEEKNHYFNNNKGGAVDEAMVMEQVGRYNDPDDEEGHLLGAVIGAVRAYRAQSATGTYAEYPLVFCAHYLGDLSMPLHNTPYDAFNKSRHSRNDGTIESEVMNNVGYIRQNIYEIKICSESDLAREVAVVANAARELGISMRNEERDMTRDEAYRQVIQSASLMKAVLVWLGKKETEGF